MIVLASASPRRRVLLQQAGVRFEVEAADVAEQIAADADPEAAAVELASRKARAVMERHANEEVWVVGADTIVAVPLANDAEGPWRLLGKPADEAEAAGMLAVLSGTRHRVVTGVCVGRCADGELASATEVTRVTMRAITPEEVEAYVASGEWRDKAGGYAIQETADVFVTGLSGGGFDNVVGLPVGLTLSLLRRLGAPLAGGPGRG
ncbi:MAG: Maf family protein [Planctomycetota bacterium]|nr:Maf family protein [Planctomycetota bacterium]